MVRKVTRNDFKAKQINGVLKPRSELSDILMGLQNLIRENRNNVNNLLESYIKSQDLKLTPAERNKFVKDTLAKSFQLNVELFDIAFFFHILMGNIVTNIDDLLHAYILEKMSGFLQDEEGEDITKLSLVEKIKRMIRRQEEGRELPAQSFLEFLMGLDLGIKRNGNPLEDSKW